MNSIHNIQLPFKRPKLFVFKLQAFSKLLKIPNHTFLRKKKLIIYKITNEYFYFSFISISLVLENFFCRRTEICVH